MKFQHCILLGLLVMSSGVYADASLSLSSPALALAVNGKPRQLTVTNTGTETVTGVRYTLSRELPEGTRIYPQQCDVLEPGQNCVFTITPGGVPGATPGDTHPESVSLMIEGQPADPVVAQIYILAIGSVYQSGYIFAMDDSTPANTSIGGKVVALKDQAPPMPNGSLWSSSPYLESAAFDRIPGIYLTSVATPVSCDGNSDGACNSRVIVTRYSQPRINRTVNLSWYAAGLCHQTQDGYSDWYLPAICEMGPASHGSRCSTGMPNIADNLAFLLADSCDGDECLAGYYWSSTEDYEDAATDAWFQYFAPNGHVYQNFAVKDGLLGVRCVRALTQTRPGPGF